LANKFTSVATEAQKVYFKHVTKYVDANRSANGRGNLLNVPAFLRHIVEKRSRCTRVLHLT